MNQIDQNFAALSQGDAMAQAPARAPWTSPEVIVSSLNDARGASITPGADGSSGSYTYGS